MDYEKKYKEALERAKGIHSFSSDIAEIKRMEQIFPELKESEDEKIRKWIIDDIRYNMNNESLNNSEYKKKAVEAIAWLEKQKEFVSADFDDVWDTADCDELTASLEKYSKDAIKEMCHAWYDKGIELERKSWLEKQGKEEYALKSFKDEDVRKFMQYIEKEAKAYEFNLPNRSYDIYAFAKDILVWLEKQGEQKPAGKVDTKFNIGDWVVNKLGDSWHIDSFDKKNYQVSDGKGNYNWFPVSKQDEMHLWTIQDAKDGDVLQLGGVTAIFQKYIGNGNCRCYCSVYNGEFEIPSQDGDDNSYGCVINAIPSTKEQRDQLGKAMADAGYTFDFEKKELKKIEEEYDGEDYGIDSLWHAHRILEKTLGKVEGYQSDDGILEHKCAISAVKKLYEQKPAGWSEEDESVLRDIKAAVASYWYEDTENVILDWLKSIRPQKPIEWSEEDEHRLKDTIYFLDTAKKHYASTIELDACVDWLKSIKPKKQWKPSDEIDCGDGLDEVSFAWNEGGR